MILSSGEETIKNQRYRITLNNYCYLLEEQALQVITEGKTGSAQGGITFRLDTPNGYVGQQVHVHVDQKKLHYAWNIDGSRSHKGNWPLKAPSKAIKQIAATQLGISTDLLEHYIDLNYTLVSEPINNSYQVLLESADAFVRV